MDKLTKLKDAYKQVVADMQAMADGAEDGFDDEKQSEFDELNSKAEGLKVQIRNCEALIKAQADADLLNDRPAPALVNPVSKDDVGVNKIVAKPKLEIPASAKRWSGNLKSFKGDDADEKAFKVGMWLAATLCKSNYAKNFCKTHGISTDKVQFDQNQLEALHQEGVNTSGGYLVFDEYENSIIRLVEEYGLARQKLKIVPMIGDTKIKPRRTGGLTSYFVGEGDQITSSDMSWDNVKLIIKKLAAITTASNELVSDAIISIADEVTREIAISFATKEDVCAFQGDGTSTYGGIVGIVEKLSTLNGVDDGGGLVLSENNTYPEVTDAELLKMIGRVPNYPGIQPEWYCSKSFWAQSMMKLIRATGGATMAEMGGMTRPMYAGYPVNFTSGTTAMPATVGNSQICCLFGDLSMAAMFGDRKGIAIATSDSATVGSNSMFDTDSFAIRGIERFDINVHDVGTSSAAGPVVGLITAAS